MRTRALLMSGLSMILLVVTGPQASAQVWTGACVLNVTFQFGSPVRLTGTNPGYTISVTPAADLDPTWSGSQPCVTSLDALSPARATSVSASGSSTLWTCGSVLASGRWDQQWTDRSGNSSPPAVFGSHTIAGSWGDWVLEVRNPSLNFLGIMPLTVHPSSASKIAQCSTGISSLTMTGVMEFQDP